jgi:hypothetical protein
MLKLILIGILLVLTSCEGLSDGTRLRQMDAQQIRTVDDATLCRIAVSMYGNAIMAAEGRRRGLNCNVVQAANYQRNNQGLPGGASGDGLAPTITNSRAPNCSGISITQAGEGQFSGIVPGIYVNVSNISGQRKWIQADIKYTQETHTALQNTRETFWETTGPLVMRPDNNNTSTFWVKEVPGIPVSNFKMVEVRVIGCGT